MTDPGEVGSEDRDEPAGFGWSEPPWTQRGVGAFDWPVPDADFVLRPARRPRSTARVAAAALVAISLVLAGMAAGVAVTNRPLGTAPNQTRLSSGFAVARDRGIVDVNTVLGYQQARAAGTGMVLTSNGDVLTNNHVIEGATSIEVTDVVTGRTYAAVVLGTDPSADVAVLHLQGASHLHVLAFGTSSGLRVGETVTALGNAGGMGGLPEVTRGVVTALHQQITAGNGEGGDPERLADMVETTASLVPGDSGGPLVDDRDAVVGMDTAAGGASLNGATANFAIPIDQALAIARVIETGRNLPKVHLGPTPFLGVEINSASTGGAAVQSVLPGTPASRTSLSGGDLIVALAGRSIASGNDLSSVLARLKVGESVTVTWIDGDGARQSAHVVLANGPAA